MALFQMGSRLALCSLLAAGSCAFRVDTSVLDTHLLMDDLTAAAPTKSVSRAVATLVATDEYVDGSIALAASLRTSKKIAALPLAAIVVVAGGEGGAGARSGVSPSRLPWISAAGWAVHPVAAADAVRCAPAGGEGMARFTNGCAKLHLWGELSGVFEQVLYVDADSFARGAFDAGALLAAFAASSADLFAAKPVPPTSQLCGGRHARVQLGLEPARLASQTVPVAPVVTYEVVFGPGPLGVALMPGAVGTAAEGSLVVSQLRAPASDLGVELGSVLVRLGADEVPLGVTPAEIGARLQQAPRPVALVFRRALSPPGGRGSGNDLLVELLSTGPDSPSALDGARAVALLHECSDLFNTNIMVLRPSKRVFSLMVVSLDHLKAQGDRSSTAFDSGFLSRFFGRHWERSEGAHWLPFNRHMEMTLPVELWPYHPAVGPSAAAVARSPAMANFLHWAEIASVDFSGPPALKPWAVLSSAQRRLASEHASAQGGSPVRSDALGAVWAAVDVAVPGGNGQTRRPLVDLIVTLFVQWVGHYSKGCADAAAANPALVAATASGNTPCALHLAFWEGLQLK